MGTEREEEKLSGAAAHGDCGERQPADQENTNRFCATNNNNRNKVSSKFLLFERQRRIQLEKENFS